MINILKYYPGCELVTLMNKSYPKQEYTKKWFRDKFTARVTQMNFYSLQTAKRPRRIARISLGSSTCAAKRQWILQTARGHSFDEYLMKYWLSLISKLSLARDKHTLYSITLIMCSITSLGNGKQCMHDVLPKTTWKGTPPFGTKNEFHWWQRWY